MAGGVLAALSVLLLASGCGVGSTGGPSAIPKNQVPFHLLTRVVPTTTTTVAPVATAAVTVYFVEPGHQHLVAAPRAVPAPPSVRTVLEELLAGPTTAERATGVRTALTDAVHLLAVRPSVVKPTTDTVTVDFNTAFGLISGTQQVLAVAQVVYTITSQAGRQIGIQFQIEGVTTDVPTATGAEVGGPVFYRQYESLTPATTTSTTTTAPGPPPT
jgi:spore germination protein GerM